MRCTFFAVAQQPVKVLFYIKRNAKRKNGLVPVMCRITVNGKQVQFSCKVEVDERLWSVKLGRMSGRSTAAQEINIRLERIRVGIDKNVTWHMSRHTYATTICLSNDVPIETLSKMLGHRSIRTTQIYAKITSEKVCRDMDKLSKRIASFEHYICQTI